MVNPIPTVNLTRYNELKNSTRSLDLARTIETSIVPYTDALGDIFWLFLWCMIFVAYWIRQRKITFPSVIALVFGGVFIAMLPEEYQNLARLFIAISVTAVVILMFTKRGEP